MFRTFCLGLIQYDKMNYLLMLFYKLLKNKLNCLEKYRSMSRIIFQAHLQNHFRIKILIRPNVLYLDSNFYSKGSDIDRFSITANKYKSNKYTKLKEDIIILLGVEAFPLLMFLQSGV